MSSFLAELKHRKVFRVGATYSVVAWLLIQVINNIATPLNMPAWSATVVIVLLGIGFPVSLVLAWAFEVTPEGLKRQPRMKPEAKHTPMAFTDYALIVLMMGIIGISSVQFRDRGVDGEKPATTEITAVEAEKPSIAVLRFTNMSPDSDQAYFAEGISEEILNELTRIEGLKVISRTSSFLFSSGEADLPTIGSRLGVNYVIEGSVRKAGDQLRITAQLIEVSSDSHLWSETYNRELKDIFIIQEDIARSITGAIQGEIGISLRADSITVSPKNLEAYQLYLKGRYFSHIRITQENSTKAISNLERTVELEPEYPEAWALLASNYLQMPVFEPENFWAWIEKTEKTAQTALSQDPNNALALAVLGLSKEGPSTWQISRKYLEQAANLETTEAETIYWFGLHLAGMGYLQEGLDQVLKAQAVDPVNPNVYRWVSNIAQELGDYKMGRQYADLAIQYGQPRFVLDVVLIDLKEGKYEDALNRLPDDDPVLRGIVEDFVAGHGPEKILALISQREEGFTKIFEQEFLIFGEWELALQEFRIAVLSENPIGGTNYMVPLWGPSAAPMRKLEGFKSLVRDLGLPEYWNEYGWPEFCQPLREDDFECH